MKSTCSCRKRNWVYFFPEKILEVCKVVHLAGREWDIILAHHWSIFLSMSEYFDDGNMPFVERYYIYYSFCCRDPISKGIDADKLKATLALRGDLL